MELEKQIYKLHYFLLSWQLARRISKVLFFTFLAMSIVFIAIFLSLTIRQSERDLRLITKDGKVCENFDNSTVYTIQILDFDSNIPALQMKFAINRYLLKLKQTTFKQHNFTQETLQVNLDKYSSGFDVIFLNFVNLETMFLVDFTQRLKSSENDIMIYNTQTREAWFWKSWALKDYSNSFFTLRIIGNILQLFQTVVGIFFGSICASFILKIFFLSTPLFSIIVKQIIIKFQGIENHHENNENWVSLYLKVLGRNNKSFFNMLFSCLAMIFFLILIFNQGLDQATILLFGKSLPHGLNIVYMIIIFWNELLSTLFFRTRSSIYFAPKYLLCIQITYLFYFTKTSIICILFLVMDSIIWD